LVTVGGWTLRSARVSCSLAVVTAVTGAAAPLWTGEPLLPVPLGVPATMAKAPTSPTHIAGSPRARPDDAVAATSAAQATIEQFGAPVLSKAPALRHEYGAGFAGWLWKPGKKVASVKRKRFFRLDGAVLSKHMTADAAEPALWHMNVQGSSLTTIAKVGFQLQVHDPAVKEAASPITLFVRTPAEQEKWVVALTGAINRKLTHFYKELSPIGEGGFAIVRRGFDRRTNEPVAIKTITKKRAHIKLYGREIAILKCVQHPSVVRTLDIFETKDKVHVVMELCEGGMLYSAVQDGLEFEEAHVAMLMRQILAGVAYLHASGICHRDLKPENVLCDSSVAPRVVKIADFGLSNVFGPQDAVMSTLIGTPEFIAPEIAMRRPYGPAVDVWAVGMIMYNVVAGKLPFDEEGDAVIGRLRQELHITFPESAWRSYSPAARSFVLALLQRDPAKRLTAQGALVHPWFDHFGGGGAASVAAPPLSPHQSPPVTSGLPPTSPNSTASASPRHSALLDEAAAAGPAVTLKTRFAAAIHAVVAYRRLALLGLPDGALDIHAVVPPARLPLDGGAIGAGVRSISTDNAHLAAALLTLDVEGGDNQVEIDEDFALDLEEATADDDSDDPSAEVPSKRSVRSLRMLVGAGNSKRDGATASLSRSSSRGQPNSSFSSLLSSVKSKIYSPAVSRSHSRHDVSGSSSALPSPRSPALAASSPRSPPPVTDAPAAGGAPAHGAPPPGAARPLNWSAQPSRAARVSDLPTVERAPPPTMTKSSVRSTVRSKLAKAFAEQPVRWAAASPTAAADAAFAALSVRRSGGVASVDTNAGPTPWGTALDQWASTDREGDRCGGGGGGGGGGAASRGGGGHSVRPASHLLPLPSAAALSSTSSIASRSSVSTDEHVASLPTRVFRQLQLQPEVSKVGRSTSAHVEDAPAGGGGGDGSGACGGGAGGSSGRTFFPSVASGADSLSGATSPVSPATRSSTSAGSHGPSAFGLALSRERVKGGGSRAFWLSSRLRSRASKSQVAKPAHEAQP